MNYIRNYGVAAVMVVVAMHQMFRVQTQDLSSWRGGGFGMYASFHPRHHDAWVTHRDTGESVRYQKYDDFTHSEYLAIRPVLTWPTDFQLARAVDRLPEEERTDMEVEIYRLDFDVETCVLKRKLLASWPEPLSSGEASP